MLVSQRPPALPLQGSHDEDCLKGALLGQHEVLVLFVLLPGLGVDFGQMLNLVAGIQVEVDANDVVLSVVFDGAAEDCPLLLARRLDDVSDLERVLHLGLHAVATFENYLLKAD